MFYNFKNQVMSEPASSQLLHTFISTHFKLINKLSKEKLYKKKMKF